MFTLQVTSNSVKRNKQEKDCQWREGKYSEHDTKPLLKSEREIERERE